MSQHWKQENPDYWIRSDGACASRMWTGWVAWKTNCYPVEGTTAEEATKKLDESVPVVAEP